MSSALKVKVHATVLFALTLFQLQDSVQSSFAVLHKRAADFKSSDMFRWIDCKPLVSKNDLDSSPRRIAVVQAGLVDSLFELLGRVRELSKK